MKWYSLSSVIYPSGAATSFNLYSPTTGLPSTYWYNPVTVIKPSLFVVAVLPAVAKPFPYILNLTPLITSSVPSTVFVSFKVYLGSFSIFTTTVLPCSLSWTVT